MTLVMLPGGPDPGNLDASAFAVPPVSGFSGPQKNVLKIDPSKTVVLAIFFNF